MGVELLNDEWRPSSLEDLVQHNPQPSRWQLQLDHVPFEIETAQGVQGHHPRSASLHHGLDAIDHRHVDVHQHEVWRAGGDIVHHFVR